MRRAVCVRVSMQSDVPVQWTLPTAPLALWMFIMPWAMEKADAAARTCLVRALLSITWVWGC